MSDRKLIYKIPAEYAGHKVLEYLNDKGYSRQLQTILKRDSRCVKVNGEPVFLNRILKENDELYIWIIEAESSEKIPPVELPVNVVYEDEDIAVVDKPSGMPIHPSLNNYDNTLGNAMAYYYSNRGEQFVYRCINRLDRDTTGLTIIAKNMLSACVLYKQMVTHQIKRTYYAIVEGTFDCQSGMIDKPIGRKNGSTIERIIDYKYGEKAVTHYEVIDSGRNVSFLKLWLETGRTHQIRVHMTSIGHPLIGDFLYNPENSEMGRQALHAGDISFYHPVTGDKISFSAPVPEDMQQTLTAEGLSNIGLRK